MPFAKTFRLRNPLQFFIALAVLAGAFMALPPSVQADPGDIGYQGPSISGAGTPTGIKRAESVLWWNDGFWWGNMWDAATQDFHIFRLNTGTQTWQDTGVAVDTRSNTHADALWDGAHLYIASHRFASDETAAVSGYPGYLFRFSYNPSTKTYSLDSGFPVQINNMRTETLVIDKDSTGKLWATWQQNNQIYLNRTLNGDDRTWGTPFALGSPDAGVTVDDNSALIAFGGNKMGLMWSNQNSSNDAMFFAVHQDGQPDTTWSASERALQGPGSADDHINLKSLQADGSGRVYAAVKTSYTSSSAALIMLLVRSAGGNWSRYPVAQVSDCPNRPMVLIDEQNDVLHSFYTAPGPPAYACTSSGGAIYEKTSPLNTPGFPTGAGTPVMVDADSPYIQNVSSTKQNVNSTTGIALLAVNSRTGYYWHAYEAISPPSPSGPPVADFAGSPASGAAPLTVSFTDTSTGSPTSWSWNFGDGGTSTAQNPQHTYSTAGAYTVSLTATNAYGSDVETKTDYVSVSSPSPPVADFTGSPASGTAPLTVAFTDTSTGSPTNWLWDFGDGATSTEQNPLHTYSTAGTYTVSLTITNGYGSDVETKTNYVNATSPPADFSVDATPSRVTISRGGTAHYTVTITPVNDFSGQVTFSVSGLPAGATATFSPNPLDATGAASATLSITTTGATKQGMHNLTITATSETLSHSADVQLQIKR